MDRKFSSKKRQSSSLRHANGKRLFTCSNNRCPNRSHYTPTCPNVTRKETGTSSAASTLPALSNVHSAENVKQGTGLGKAEGNIQQTFDRFATMVEETEESFPTVLSNGTQEWKNRAGELHRSGDQPAIIRDGAQMWYREGLLHRDNDLPAVINPDGTQIWCRNGKLHRDGDRPARICSDGSQEWWRLGKLHRGGDLPAKVYPNEYDMWYQHGKLHRSGDLPAVILANGTQMWYRNGELHRGGDMPAVIYADGRKEWWRHNKRHRTTGPALTFPSGYQEWWVEDKESKKLELCEQASSPVQTVEGKNRLVLLCLHDDPVVAAIAAHNPDCPEEGTIAYNLKRA